MENWEDLRYLLAVARAGTASGAATLMRTSHATVSRRIAKLEEKLQIHLVDRSSLAWVITPAAQKIADKASQMEHLAFDAERIAQAHSSDLSGTVRITTGVIGFKAFVLSALKSVRTEYPQIQFEMIASDDILDLSSRKADIAIRFTQSPDTNLFGRNICAVKYGVYGTHNLVAEFERQRKNAHHGQLPNIPLIDFMGNSIGQPDWSIGHIQENAPFDLVDSIALLIEAARLGFGLAALPYMIGNQMDDLVLIPSIPVPSYFDLWVLSHSDTQKSARIKAVKTGLISHLQKRIPEIETVSY